MFSWNQCLPLIAAWSCYVFLYFFQDVCPSKLWKIPWISSHCPSNTFLSNWSSILHLFFSWICLLHCHSYSKPVNRYHTLLEVLWQLWVPPSSLFKNYTMVSYYQFLKTIICASCMCHFCCNAPHLCTCNSLVVKNHIFRHPSQLTSLYFLCFLLT